ncbi:class B sortase, partial [Streptococcus cuniculi]
RDDSYYLSHDVDGAETYYGAIFTELVNTKTFEDPITIIYGHAMTDGTMFGSLQDFSDPSFFHEHKTISVETVDTQYEYEIMAAHLYTDDHLFSTFELGNQAGVHHYLATLQERALASGGAYRSLPVEKDKDRFLILSTCDAVNNDQRYVVTARLKDVKERSKDD